MSERSLYSSSLVTTICRVCAGKSQYSMKTRQQILDATERTLQTKGLARVTTKDIASAAGCAEGTLFNHFAHKDDLLLATLREKIPEFAALMREDRPGKRTVAENLEEIGSVALDFYRQILPLLGALFADPELLARHQELLKQHPGGPRLAYQTVGDYIVAEQALGRVRSDANPLAVAALLLGACFQFAFMERLTNQAPLGASDAAFLQGTVNALTCNL
jgi:AcrR family transcriptional regulator